ncbi:unnamed protein product, partial [Effrenium voratum]
MALSPGTLLHLPGAAPKPQVQGRLFSLPLRRRRAHARPAWHGWHGLFWGPLLSRAAYQRLQRLPRRGGGRVYGEISKVPARPREGEDEKWHSSKERATAEVEALHALQRLHGRRAKSSSAGQAMGPALAAAAL